MTQKNENRHRRIGAEDSTPVELTQKNENQHRRINTEESTPVELTQKNWHRRADTQESTQKKNRHRRIDTEQESTLHRNVEGNSGNRRNNKLKRQVGRMRVTGKNVALKREEGKDAEKNKCYTEESSGGIGTPENANWKMKKNPFLRY